MLFDRMISFDTNVLVRVFMDDDIAQAEQARTLFRQQINSDGIYISSYVVMEFMWVLKSNKFSKQQMTNVLRILLSSANVTIGQTDLVTEALSLFEKGQADFSDYLIMLDSQKEQAKGLQTFDINLKNAARSFFSNPPPHTLQ